MRKIKSTALLGAFVAIAGVTAVSHKAGAASLGYSAQSPYAEEVYQSITLGTNTINLATTQNVAKNGTVVLTLQNAQFPKNVQVDIGLSSTTANCSGTPTTPTSSLTLSCASALNASSSYIIGDDSSGDAGTSLSIIPTNTNPAILTFTSSAPGELSASVTLTSVSQQLAIQSISNSNYTVNSANLTQFTSGSANASNSISFSNYANGNNWSDYITSGTLNFVFNGIPSSVTSITGTDAVANNNVTIPSSSFANGSVTASISLGGLLSTSSDTYTFTFSNSGNIQPANITVGPIFGSSLSGHINLPSATFFTYQTSSSSFMTWTFPGVQIYVPSAFVPTGNNIIKAGYIILTMPTSASIASISILNSGGVSCSVSNVLTPTGLTGQYYIDLSKLPSSCPGVPTSAWTSGVPLVINISSSGGILASQVAAEGWSYISGFGLQHLSVDVINISSNSSAFYY